MCVLFQHSHHKADELGSQHQACGSQSPHQARQRGQAVASRRGMVNEPPTDGRMRSRLSMVVRYVY